VPDLQAYITLGCEVEDFDGVPVVRLNDSPLIGWYAAAKRLTDIVVAGVGLLVISPLLLLIGALVRLTSPGPILYSQERMGLDGKTFHMLKFRSMKVDAEQQSGAVWCQKVDDRRTAFGTFLRKTSLDELPQLWNVLVGDMSLVGPRPYLEREIPEMEQKEAIILRVKPGITGIWQVTERNASTFERRLHMDVEYVRSWSPWLDIYVLARTIPVVLGGTGS
jgi:exopolysaccharide biosynthesis polyprenyl glycosylphosphotransferase